MDKRNQDELLEIARLQHALVSLQFDWKRRQPNDQYSRADYAQLHQKLEECTKLRKLVFQPGIFWWHIPPEAVTAYIREHLSAEESRLSWRTEWRYLEHGQDAYHVIGIAEEGHCSSFSGSRSYEYTRISPYSEAEQADMVRKYNRDRDVSEWFDAATTEGKVYSETYNRVYDSAHDYYASFEHQMARQSDSDSYARSLYKEKTTETIQVHSNSQHYTGAFSIAGFEMNHDGTVVSVTQKEPTLLFAEGNGTDRAGQSLRNKDISLLICGYFACAGNVRYVSDSIFGFSLDQPSHSYEDALHRAACFTCLAPKLRPAPIPAPPQPIPESEHAHYGSLLNRLATEDPSVTAEETSSVLRLLENGQLIITDQQSHETRVSLLRYLFLKSDEDFDLALFYLIRAFEASVMGKYYHPSSVFLTESTFLTGATLAEAYLSQKDKAEAARYAKAALDACKTLEQLAPGLESLTLKKSVEKTLKKAQKTSKWFF